METTPPSLSTSHSTESILRGRILQIMEVMMKMMILMMRLLQIMLQVSRKPTEHTPVGLEDMERRTDCQDYSRILPIRCSGSVQPTPGAPSTGTKPWRRGSRLGFTLQVCSGFRDRSPTVESLQMTSTVLSGQE